MYISLMFLYLIDINALNIIFKCCLNLINQIFTFTISVFLHSTHHEFLDAKCYRFQFEFFTPYKALFNDLSLD